MKARKTITIEWQHLDVAGETCHRCGDTGGELDLIVAQLRAECAPRGVDILFRETLLTADQISRSNTILINGVPLETILPNTRASASCCASCSDLSDRPEQSRTIVHLGKEYETIPRELIQQAVCKIGECC